MISIVSAQCCQGLSDQRRYSAVYPPSALMQAPVIMDAALLAKNDTTRAISIGCPKRPMGCFPQ